MAVRKTLWPGSWTSAARLIAVAPTAAPGRAWKSIVTRLPPSDDAIGVVLISVDPERDTPEVLKSYVASFDAPITALTGTPEAVAQAAKAYRVYYAKHPRSDGGYDMDHSAVIYVIDPQGRFTATFTPDSPADAIAARLQKLLS